MASAVMEAVSGRGTREARGWRGTAPLSFEWGSKQGGKGRRAAVREEKQTAALGMVGRGDGGRLGWRWDLLGRLYWADWADWAAQKRKEGGRRRWAGLERKEKRESLFVFFKLKHHLNDYFGFKQNLNFGCYKSYPLKMNLVLEIRIGWRTIEGILP